MEAPAPAPDWSELPADILYDVLTLLECPDLVRSGAVCAAWHTAYSTSTLRRAGICPVRQTPCLIYYTEAAGGLKALGMYSLSEKKAYTMQLPESPIKNWIGASHGWLITMDDKSELMLLNPITGNTNVLPQITTMEHVKPVLNGDEVLEKYEVFYYDGETPRVVEEDTAVWSLEEYGHMVYLKATLSCDPSVGGCIVMLIHQPYGQLSFAKVGDDHWNWLNVSSYYRDCVYHDGWFYAVTEEGAIDAYNLHGPSVIHKRLLPQIIQTVSKCHVVRAQSGDVLQIIRRQLLNPDHDQPGSREWVTEIKVYRVDFDDQKCVNINEIGDYALFIGSSTTSCLSLKDYPDLMPNHVYFTDDDDATHIFRRDDPPEVGIYDIKNNTRVNVVHPELWMNWLPPIWLMPSLAKTGMVVP
ncbi:probable F-box protein At4g22165 [Aegilops tauschii subsp. strangulata]|uniref:probable F-box protein At4g22165 n=1 Tax=Aegilops tauschii subsp. strangulata TaxID=200361 RepID=UPI00098A674F